MTPEGPEPQSPPMVERENMMDVEQLPQTGLEQPQIERLIRLKERYDAHEVSELTIAAKYMEFVKFLVETDRLYR
jgi:hypothetical protein